MIKRYGWGFLVATLLIILWYVSNGSQKMDHSIEPNEPIKGKFVIGAKFFPEQYLLLKLTSIYLKELGYEVEEKVHMETNVIRSSLENGKIDLYWEYTGTALVNFHGQEAELDPQITYQKVKALDEDIGLIWLQTAGFNNAFSLSMKKETADQLGIKSISDLARNVRKRPGDFSIAITKEFYERKDGLSGLQSKYQFSFLPEQVIQMDQGLTYRALKEGQVNIAIGFATDAFQYESIKNQEYVMLEDDQSFFPSYHAAPLARNEILLEYPDLEGSLNAIADRLDTDTMMRLIYLVEEKQQDVSEVARNWLKQEGLIR